jgi:hypothetical protein
MAVVGFNKENKGGDEEGGDDATGKLAGKGAIHHLEKIMEG